MSSKPAFPKQLSSIGNFKLGAPFGNGNHALIRLGEHMGSGEKVVIKEIAKGTPKTNRKLRREVDIMSKLRHPSVVRLHHTAETNDRYFLIMQYASQGDLLDIILKAGHLTPEISKKWFAQLVLGVEYLHTQNVCHCDLKPDNLFIDNQNNLKIGDYGLSCHYDPTEARVLARPGTLHYSAPETFARNLRTFGYDAQSYFSLLGLDIDEATHCAIVNGPELDVWGIGVVLYVMQTGKYPFWGINKDHPEDQLPTIEAILCQDEPRWPSWIEPACMDLLKRIFQKNPRLRITIPEIKVHPWAKAEFERQESFVRDEVAIQQLLQQQLLAHQQQQRAQQQMVHQHLVQLQQQQQQQPIAALDTASTQSPVVTARVHADDSQDSNGRRNFRSSILPRHDTMTRTPSTCSRASSYESTFRTDASPESSPTQNRRVSFKVPQTAVVNNNQSNTSTGSNINHSNRSNSNSRQGSAIHSSNNNSNNNSRQGSMIHSNNNSSSNLHSLINNQSSIGSCSAASSRSNNSTSGGSRILHNNNNNNTNINNHANNNNNNNNNNNTVSSSSHNNARASRANLIKLHQYSTCMDLRQALQTATSNLVPTSGTTTVQV